MRDAKSNLIQFVSDSMDRPLSRTDVLGHTANVLLYDGPAPEELDHFAVEKLSR